MDGGSGAKPDPAALARVRADLAALGADADSAPEVPPAVTARVVAALRAEPAHSVPRPRLRRAQLGALLVGLVATLTAGVVGAVMLTREPAPLFATGPTAERITVDRAAGMPIPDAKILETLSQPPDFGLLADPAARASCLEGLGYPTTTPVLGARTVDQPDGPAVLLVLPDRRPDAVVAALVRPTCNAAHPALVARAVLDRP